MKALLQQALEALESLFSGESDPLRPLKINNAILALRTAIEQAEQAQPVAWVNLNLWKTGKYWPDDCFSDNYDGDKIPLYAQPKMEPKPSKPLSEEQVFAAMKRIVPNWNGCGNSRESAVRLALRVIKEQS